MKKFLKMFSSVSIVLFLVFLSVFMALLLPFLRLGLFIALVIIGEIWFSNIVISHLLIDKFSILNQIVVAFIIAIPVIVIACFIATVIILKNRNMFMKKYGYNDEKKCN